MSVEDIYAGVHEVDVSPPGHAVETTGLVVKWRRRGAMWEALVTHEVDGKVLTEWLPALNLAPEEGPS